MGHPVVVVVAVVTVVAAAASLPVVSEVLRWSVWVGGGGRVVCRRGICNAACRQCVNKVNKLRC